MKKACYILFVFVISALVACDKDNKGQDDRGTRDLQGGWALRERSAAMGPIITYNSGTEHILTFRENKYYIYESGEKIAEGTYTTMIDTTVEQNVCLVGLASDFNRRIVFDNDLSSPKIFFYVNKDELITISGCYAIDAGQKKIYGRLRSL
ncbi:hypothetical protein [Longitalea arenae]|uniref:hypothetical protein n=1 Tax=Longitalea arenae TaxID=2812558 RepID=UPI001967E2C9|nr:hypothetical protein [Longitalea arenae]